MQKCVLIITLLFAFTGCVDNVVRLPPAEVIPDNPDNPDNPDIPNKPEYETIFEWDSETTPMSGSIGAGAPVGSGFNEIDFRVIGSSITTTEGAFRLGADGRLVVGAAAGSSTSDSTHVPGVFDFSEGTFRLTIDYLDPVVPGSNYLLRILINNNQTGQASSVLGTASNLRQYNDVSKLNNGFGAGASNVFEEVEANRLILTFTPNMTYANVSTVGISSLATAFFTLNCQGSSRITVKSIRLEKVQSKYDASFNPDLSKDYLLYSEFGAKGDGKTDDFDAIIETHIWANRFARKVRADSGAVYYIGEGGAKTARIETDTDWTGAQFIIDDSAIEIFGDTWSNTRMNDSFIFEVASSYNITPITSVGTLQKNQAKLNLSLLSDSVIVVTDSNTKRYIRRGDNANSGSDQTDVFIVDKTGNVNMSTPIIWDFNTITSMTAQLIDKNVLTIKGGIFTTIANKGHADNRYMKRSIRITRSNVVIDGLTHLIVGEGEQGAGYEGFLRFEDCANAVVKNCTLTGHRGYRQPSQPSTTRGSYDLYASRVINLFVINCGQSNDIHNSIYWGVFVSHFSKNITFDNVKFSRFDAHQGVHNVTVKNSELGHQGINLIGSGESRFENTKVSSLHFINLRSDYGSTWEGNTFITDCTFVPSNFSSSAIINSDNDGKWNFGYDCFMPGTITIEGLVVNESAAPSNYSGIYLVKAVNTNTSTETYPYTLTKILYLRNFQSGKAYRMSNSYITSQIKVLP